VDRLSLTSLPVILMMSMLKGLLMQHLLENNMPGDRQHWVKPKKVQYTHLIGYHGSCQEDQKGEGHSSMWVHSSTLKRTVLYRI
jgi:hypothetical protein